MLFIIKEFLSPSSPGPVIAQSVDVPSLEHAKARATQTQQSPGSLLLVTDPTRAYCTHHKGIWEDLDPLWDQSYWLG